jgi:hypothetical protein
LTAIIDNFLTNFGKKFDFLFVIWSPVKQPREGGI